MASNSDAMDRFKLYKFTKILTQKVAQIVVQSRQGKKITHDYNTSKSPDELPSSPSNLQWFNLSISDEPQVSMDTKRILNGEVIEALANVLCIEISLKTVDGDDMILELWTVRMVPGCDIFTSISTIYYRMSIMLKSTLSITRITPAYKMSRLQHKESYKIFHKIYGGQPNPEVLGERYKTIKVSELHTPLGTILIEVMYRTKMTILPQDRARDIVTGTKEMYIKDNHFRLDSPRKIQNEKKELDLNKPLTAGAFVDAVKIKELHDALSQQLPPEPPMKWLLAEKDKMEKRMKQRASTEYLNNRPGCSGVASTSTVRTASKAIEVPKPKEGNRYASLMEFPFADGSPITELANFYQECLQARSASEEWTEVFKLTSASDDSESLSQQLKMYEEAVPEFDSMVASMFSNSENASEFP